VDEHGAMVARIAASYERDPHRAQDLVQEILFAVWKAMRSFRGEAALRTFVARIAHNRAISHVAQSVKRAPTMALDEGLPSSLDGPEQAAIQHDQQARLTAAVQGLPLAYRYPVTLMLEGFSPAEIAEILGLTPNSVSIRLTRAKSLLRGALGEFK
jgi:RNA polymerase sigma-70 factor (ECF subfamily)